MRTTVFFLATMLLAATPADSEELLLKDGTTLNISGFRMDGLTYVVTLENGDQRRVPRADVEHIKPSEASRAPKAAPASPAKVFTNQDLPEGGRSESSPPPPRAARGDRQIKQYEKARTREEKKWKTWHDRYVRIQARVDASQETIDRLEQQADAVSGDIDRAGDGTKITAVRPGRGYYFHLERAKRERDKAQAAIDKLREEAAAAGVPPGELR